MINMLCRAVVINICGTRDQLGGREFFLRWGALDTGAELRQ